jgi:hypothetical protein
MIPASDTAVRTAAFQWLAEQTALHGEVLPWSLLLQGFTSQGERVPLVIQQGIFKPRLRAPPLSIRTSPGGPYADASSTDDLLLDKYCGTNLLHRENAAQLKAGLGASRTPSPCACGAAPRAPSSCCRQLGTWRSSGSVPRLGAGEWGRRFVLVPRHPLAGGGAVG